MKRLTVMKAIACIVDYETLPPQIDYTVPWQIKAREAEEYLRKLTPKSQDRIFRSIAHQVNKYYNSGAAYYDSLF